MRIVAPLRSPISASRVTMSAQPSMSEIRPVSPTRRQSKGTMSTDRSKKHWHRVETESQYCLILHRRAPKIKWEWGGLSRWMSPAKWCEVWPGLERTRETSVFTAYRGPGASGVPSSPRPPNSRHRTRYRPTLERVRLRSFPLINRTLARYFCAGRSDCRPLDSAEE